MAAIASGRLEEYGCEEREADNPLFEHGESENCRFEHPVEDDAEDDRQSGTGCWVRRSACAPGTATIEKGVPGVEDAGTCKEPERDTTFPGGRADRLLDALRFTISTRHWDW